MALPPTIPTSFVPHPGSAAVRRRTDLTGAFAFFAYGVLGIVVFLAIAAFIYDSILVSAQKNKDAGLAKAIAGIDPSTVEGFVHLRDRLSTGERLLSAHPALSNLFAVLSSILPASVRFTELHLTAKDTGDIALEGTGMAKSFNALAAASDAFAADGRIKDVIFSGIKVTGSVVTFTIAASVSPSLVAFVPPAPAPAATTTATTTMP